MAEPGYVSHTVVMKALLEILVLAPWSLLFMSEVGPAKMYVSSQMTIYIAQNGF